MIYLHKLWYQQCSIHLQVLVKVMCLVAVSHHTLSRDGSKLDQQGIDFCTQKIIKTFNRSKETNHTVTVSPNLWCTDVRKFQQKHVKRDARLIPQSTVFLT
jgi:hypothetical protein